MGSAVGSAAVVSLEAVAAPDLDDPNVGVQRLGTAGSQSKAASGERRFATRSSSSIWPAHELGYV